MAEHPDRNGISEIFVSADERAAGSLAPENLEKAVGLLDEHGFVIVRNAIDSARLKPLLDIMNVEWSRFHLAKADWYGGGRIVGHLNIVPPKRPEFIDPDILANPLIHPITAAVLGNDAKITAIGGNANLANSVDQYFHSDLDTPDFGKLMVNIPLGDVDEGNGSLEIIPGFAAHPENARTKALRANTRSGDVIIRYLHVMHRGKRNPSPNPRFMLGYWLASAASARDIPANQMLDPNAPDILADCRRLFEGMGLPEPQPVFQPNYFTPTMSGLIKEITYRAFPGAYLFALKMLRHRRHAATAP